MSDINIIREALNEAMLFANDELLWASAKGPVLLRIDGIKSALTALDSLTVKVSDEEIERMVDEWKIPGTIECRFGPVEKLAAIGVLRHARDKWLVPSPWISVETAIPCDGVRVRVKDEHGEGWAIPAWSPFTVHNGDIVHTLPQFDGWMIEADADFKCPVVSPTHWMLPNPTK